MGHERQRQRLLAGPEPDGDRGSSLRRRRYDKVPEIAHQPLNTLLPVLRGGEEHPHPYFITQNLVLKIADKCPPWLEPTKDKGRALRDGWKTDQRMAAKFRGELDRQRGQPGILRWLEEHVVADRVHHEVERLAWETMWHQARKLSPSEAARLHKVYEDLPPDKDMLDILRDNCKKPLDPVVALSLLDHHWGEVLYHTNVFMVRDSLGENYAIRKLQHQIVSQVASGILLDEALRAMDHGMKEFDEAQRTERPPGKVQ